jgi:hypothetical protein
MEATFSSDTLIDFQRTTRCYIPEDGTLHNHRCENLTPVALVRERTIPTERPPLVREVVPNLRIEGVTWSAQRIPTVDNLCFLDRLKPYTVLIMS